MSRMVRVRVQDTPHEHHYEMRPEAVELPCRHLGVDLGETAECGSCNGRVRLKLHACSRHTLAVLGPQRASNRAVACCAECKDYEADSWRHVAPAGCAGRAHPWEGRADRKPWSYAATVAIPHLNTLDLLPAALDLWRLQTERPYLMMIDTGSPPAVCEALEKLRAPDLEIHYLRAHGYCHSSAPVTTALDAAHALCRTGHLLHVHADVFPRRRDLVAWLLEQCTEAVPVVGWEMSPRSASPLWKGTVSHTCTMLHMPTMRRIGANWSMERWYERHGRPAGQTVGWPDSESSFKDSLDDASIVPLLMGGEPNFELHRTEWFDHARSVTGSRVYGHGLASKIEAYAAKALAEAKARAIEWKAQTC